jgi:uncharacterized protein DUF4129
MAAGILAALTVVAIASRGSTPSGEPGVRRPTDTLMDVFLSFYLLTLVLGAALLLYGMLLQRRSLAESGGRARRSWWNGIGGLVLVAGAVLLLRQRATRDADTRPPEIEVLPGGTTPTPATGSDGAAPTYEPEFAWIPVTITLALLALAVTGFWWSGRRRRSARGELAGTLLADEVAAAVDESLDDLRAEPDPRRAVIATYARLERVLASHGLPRRPAEAPLEYLRRMLAHLSVSPKAARTLTDLFERAKFSQHAVEPEMKEQAIGALETVRDDLAAARALAEQERAAALAALRERAAR